MGKILGITLKKGSGITIPELVISVSIFSVAALGFLTAFQYITKSIRVSRARSLAANLAQEKVEVLKNYSYYSLKISTEVGSDGAFSPPIVHDVGNFPPEDLTVGGITFTRYTHVALAEVTNNVVTAVTYSYPDTGMKKITVSVVWPEGSEWKKWQLSNLLENPYVATLDAVIKGPVNKATGGPLAGANVVIAENPDWTTTTNSAGNYSFSVYHGSYTVRASSAGYYDATTSLISVGAGRTEIPAALSMVAIASGTISGNVWISSGLVISQIVASTAQANDSNFIAQYIELFNPTTYTITIGGATPPIKVNLRGSSGCTYQPVCTNATYGIKLDYANTSVGPGKYYLIANTGTFTLGGVTYTPDAKFADDADSYCTSMSAGIWDLAASPKKRMLLPYDASYPGSHAATVWLTDSAGAILDSVGYSHNANVATGCEGGCISQTVLSPGQQIVRISSPAATLANAGMDAYGRAYDSDDNRRDFAYPALLSGIVYAPKTSLDSTTWPVLTGKPAAGTYVATSDTYSGSTVAYTATIASGSYSMPYATYALQGVTTGSWAIVYSSSSYFLEVPTVTITQGVISWMPNATSTTSWTLAGNYGMKLTSSTVQGFLEGQVTSTTGGPLSGIIVLAGGSQKTTDSNGRYFMPVSSGPITAVYNLNLANPNYVSESYQPTISQGQVTTQNVILTRGGTLYGYVTSGTTPLPNVIVTANIAGSQYGSGTSDTGGYFYIRNITTGTFTVSPVLETGQDSSPNSVSATLSGAQTLHVGTFTVSGSMGTLAGTVTVSGAALSSGALVIASTATLASTPPTIVASSAPAQTVRYMASTQPDGTYSLPLRGLATYYLSIFVPSVNPTAGTVTVSTKTYSGIYVPSSGITTLNITVP